MKVRITGRVNGDNYEIVGVDGSVTQQIPLADASKDTKLAAAIKRNGWEALPDETP